MSNSYSVTFESTPNPATMKFNLGKAFTDSPFDCKDAQAAEKSPLATKIFGFPWTSSVYIGTDFITVTKQDWVDWQILSAPLAGLIEEHIRKGEPIVLEVDKTKAASDENETDTEVVRQIKRVINQRIRPVVAYDGGDIVFAKYEDNVVYIHMQGSCAGCPSSTATLKDGIETTLKEAIPEIKEVVAI